MKTPKTRELVEHFIHELYEPNTKLTQWEQDFVESVSDQFDRRGTLTDKQFEVLERIYAEKTA